MKKKIAKFVKLTRAERRAMKKDHRACADVNYYPDSKLGKSWFDPYQAQYQWLPRGMSASLAWQDKKKLRELGLRLNRFNKEDKTKLRALGQLGDNRYIESRNHVILTPKLNHVTINTKTRIKKIKAESRRRTTVPLPLILDVDLKNSYSVS